MNSNSRAHTIEHRKQPRITIPEHPQISDANSGETLGHLVNLSVDGLMLVGANCIPVGNVYQLRIPIVRGDKRAELVLGAESLWCQDANESGTFWTGFQIIDISPEQENVLAAIIKD